MLIDKICNNLGIEVNQQWFGWDGEYWNLYKLCEDGILRIKEYSGDSWNTTHNGWSKILLNEVKPLDGDLYYVVVHDTVLRLLPERYNELFLVYNDKRQTYEWKPYSYGDKDLQYMYTEHDLKHIKNQNNMSLYTIEEVEW